MDGPWPLRFVPKDGRTALAAAEESSVNGIGIVLEPSTMPVGPKDTTSVPIVTGTPGSTVMAAPLEGMTVKPVECMPIVWSATVSTGGCFCNEVDFPH